MKISIDCDDVISDTVPITLNLINKLYNKNIPLEEFDPIWQNWEKTLGKRTRKELIKHFFNYDFLYSIPVLPGAIEGVKALKELGVEIYVITSRDEKSPATRDWVNKHFKNLINDVIFIKYKDGKQQICKGELCKLNNIDLHIEDNPIHVDEVKSYNIKTLVFNQHWNKDYPNSKLVKRAKDWQDVVRIVKEMINS